MTPGECAARLETLAQELVQVARALRAGPGAAESPGLQPGADAGVWPTYAALRDALPTLSARAHAVLWALHIRSWPALATLGRHQLLRQRNCGPVTCAEIVAFIGQQQARNGQEGARRP